jgi:hypothetical protein
MDLSILFSVVTTTIIITIAASRQDRGKLNDVMMRSRRRLQRSAVSLSLFLFFSLSFSIVDSLFSLDTKIDR